MSSPITVKIKVNQIGKYVFEISGIMKGQFYKRQFIGYSRQKAVKLFSEWLNEQL